MSNEEIEKRLQEIWEGDVLGRRADAEFLKSFLVGQLARRREQQLPSSFVLNLNASWGEGKTFFLERLAKSLALYGFAVASVNAWKDDHAADPLLPVMVAIESIAKAHSNGIEESKIKSFAKFGAHLVASGAKGAGFQALKKLTGLAAEDLAETLSEAAQGGVDGALKKAEKFYDEQADKILGGFKHAQKTTTQFRAALRELASSLHPLPLVVLIDELDRCRPTFAIEMLERIKHLFDVNDVLFVVATDTEQLQHAVSAVYGESFDGKRYLNRFFDTSYSFATPSKSTFSRFLCATDPIPEDQISLPPSITLIDYFTGAAHALNLSLRDMQQTYSIVSNVVSAWTYKTRVELAVLIPLAAAHSLKNTSVEFSADFAQAMNKRVHECGRSQEWIINFAGRKGAIEAAGGMELFELFLNLSAGTMPRMFEDDPPRDRGSDHWVWKRLIDEYRNVWDRQTLSRGARSILRYYPGMVLTAGRLQPLDQEIRSS